MRRAFVFPALCLAMLLLTSCQHAAPNIALSADHATSTGSIRIQSCKLNDPVQPIISDDAITVDAAKNEWIGFAVQVAGLPDARKKASYRLRIHPATLAGHDGAIPINNFSIDQILPLPADLNRAEYIRHSGLSAAERSLARALLPMKMTGDSIDLSSARDPGDPANPQSHLDGSTPLLFWIDLHLPKDCVGGDYLGRCDILPSNSQRPVASVPIRIVASDFALPDERHLHLVSHLDWDDLRRLDADDFDKLSPAWLNRTDPKYAGAVRMMDALIALAHDHRADVVIPRLAPVVKWGESPDPPNVDWSDFDTLLAPWMDGSAFADKMPMDVWPLPAANQLARYDASSQLAYWKNAADHFKKHNWLSRSPIVIYGGATPGESPEDALVSDAEHLLAIDPSVRVSLPLQNDQFLLADARNPKPLDAKSIGRLITAAPGFVFNAPMKPWPAELPRPAQSLRINGHAGADAMIAASEGDVRAWAWLAFLRHAESVQLPSSLPRTSAPRTPVNPDDLVWFYPGNWFGVDHPLASIQLKWLRRAEQDYEYLLIASQRHETANAMMMARLLTRPVELPSGQSPEPIDALMTGTVDPAVWSEAHRLLTKLILLHHADQKPDPQQQRELNLEILRWTAPQDIASLIAQAADWSVLQADPHALGLSAAFNVYNASDTQRDQNRLQWTQVPRGWQVSDQPITTPALASDHVGRIKASATFDLASVDARDRSPAQLTFTNGFNARQSKVQMILPVAATDRLHRSVESIDGRLDEWDADSAICDAPLVRMLNRPAIQTQSLQLASTNSTIYTGWTNDDFFVAFRVHGARTSASTARNFIQYDAGRAWGEDVCELLIQPIFKDNTPGPVLHIACKPEAGLWVERKPDPKAPADAWLTLEGAGVRYAAHHAGDWTGELAIPWRAITGRENVRPTLLRFNFAQHVQSTGQSATWAGPVDSGRDNALMGVLYLRNPQ